MQRYSASYVETRIQVDEPLDVEFKGGQYVHAEIRLGIVMGFGPSLGPALAHEGRAKGGISVILLWQSTISYMLAVRL
jgi:hypothetical protein